MAVLITESTTKLEFDTLGAVKISNFVGDITPIYSYARFYAVAGELAVGIKVFERSDIADSTVTLRIKSPDSEDELCIELCLNVASYCYVVRDGVKSEIDASVANFYSGDDNQGFYWGVNFSVEKNTLKQINLKAVSGVNFLANILLTRSSEKGCGSACSDHKGFDDFIIVPY